MSAKRGQFIFSAIVVVGCLLVGVALAVEFTAPVTERTRTSRRGPLFS